MPKKRQLTKRGIRTKKGLARLDEPMPYDYSSQEPGHRSTALCQFTQSGIYGTGNYRISEIPTGSMTKTAKTEVRHTW